MLRSVKENIGVIVYKNTELSGFGKLTTFLLVSSVALAISSNFVPSTAFWAAPLSIVGVLIVLVQLVLSYKEQLASSFDQVVVSPKPTESYKELAKDRTPSFDVISLPSHAKVSYSESLNNELWSNKTISIVREVNFEKALLKNWHENKENLSKLLVFKSQQPGYLFNESKVALMTSLTSGLDSVDLGKTSYFTSLITNEAAGKELINEASDSSINFNNMLPIKGDMMLDIASSKLSNHIGVTLLGLSRDNHLVFWTQNSNAQISVNSLVATGSGSLDWKDISKSNADDLLGIVKYGMARELTEESNLNKEMTIKLSRDEIMVTGFFRWIQRGGKPEFVGICNIPVATSMFHPNLNEVNNKLKGKMTEHPLVNTMGDLAEICDEYLNDENLKIGVSTEFLLYQLHQASVDESSPYHQQIKNFWNLK